MDIAKIALLSPGAKNPFRFFCWFSLRRLPVDPSRSSEACRSFAVTDLRHIMPTLQLTAVAH
jgi:hypothetical protein